MQLDYVKSQVNAKVEPFYTAYQKAIASPYGSLTYKPTGPPKTGIINCGYFSNPNDGCSEDSNDGTAAYLQSLLWYITGNSQYANNAIALLDTYSSTLTQFNNSNAEVQAAWSGLKWTRAAEIIRHTNASWSDAGIMAYAKLLTSVYLPLIYNGSGFNGNWELSMIEAMLGIAVYTEDWDLFNHATGFWSQRVPAYLYYAPTDGDKPHPPPRGYPTWYGQTVFNMSTNGMCQETCRDMGHTQMGVSSLLNAAETARIQGVDLYGSESARIMAGLEFNANILISTTPVPAYVCNGTVHMAEQPTWEIGYNQFHNRLGNDLPHTWEQIVEHVRNMTNLANTLTCVWETLSHGGSPK